MKKKIFATMLCIILIIAIAVPCFADSGTYVPLIFMFLTVVQLFSQMEIISIL